MLLQAAITNKAQIEAALPDLEAKVAAARRNANEAQKALSEAIAQRGLKQTAMNKKITERSYYPSKINEATRAQNWQKVAELNQELTKLQAEIDQLAAEIAQINQTIPGLNQNAQNMEALLFAANTNLSRARSELLVAKADIEKYKPLVAQCNGGQVSAA